MKGQGATNRVVQPHDSQSNWICKFYDDVPLEPFKDFKVPCLLKLRALAGCQQQTHNKRWVLRNDAHTAGDKVCGRDKPVHTYGL